MTTPRGWIGVDLDGTLAVSVSGAPHFIDQVGAPVPVMVDRVRAWLAAGWDVRIVTARVHSGQPEDIREASTRAIQQFCETQFGRVLPVTSEKDYGMVQLWDDRARQVMVNTGVPATEVLANSLTSMANLLVEEIGGPL